MNIKSAYDNKGEALQLLLDLQNCGCEMIRETQKVSLFHTSNGNAFYVLWDSKGVDRSGTKHPGLYALALDPTLDSSSVVALPGVVESCEHFNSNMTAFPKKIKTGQTKCAFGMRVVVRGKENLKRLIQHYDAAGDSERGNAVSAGALSARKVVPATNIEYKEEIYNPRPTVDYGDGVQTSVVRESEQRLHQDDFRRKLDAVWGNQCAVTEVRCRQCLVASHIKPWAECTDEEKLDPNNGLLLNVALDALFDNHLITFDEEGLIKVSPKVDQATLDALGISRGMRLRKPFIFANHERYLKHHWAGFLKNC